MAAHFALLIDPVPASDRRGDYTSTFRSVDPSAPALSVGELSTQRGDGVFESIGAIGGHPQDRDAHLSRLAHSAALCDLPEPNREQWQQAVTRIAAGFPSGEWVIKLILSRGVESGPTPTAWATAAPAPDFTQVRQNGVSVVTLDRGYDLDAGERAPWLLLGAKTLSYAVNMAALREARRRGAEDAVFVTRDGYLLEAPTATVILRREDRFLTPEPKGILHGITQLSLFDFLARRGSDAEYATLTEADLANADAAWLVSSIRLAAPIISVNGRPLLVDAEVTADFNRHLLTPH